MLCACLALAGAATAAAAAAFSIFPVTATRIDRGTLRSARQPVRPVRAIGLDHSGGDLRRAVRLTRRSRRCGFGQFQVWTDDSLIVPAQATHRVLLAAP